MDEVPSTVNVERKGRELQGLEHGTLQCEGVRSGRRPSKGGGSVGSEAGGKLRGNDFWKPSEERVLSREGERD